jgi:outer membrane protein
MQIAVFLSFKYVSDNKQPQAMKTYFIIPALVFLMMQGVSAQKVACVNTGDILAAIPEYRQAKEQLDKQSQQWKTEVEDKLKEVENMYNKYVETQSMLSEGAKKEKQDAIIEAEKAAKKFKEEKFGADGEMQKLEEKLVQPIRDKIKTAIEVVSTRDGWDFVFDKSESMVWLYINPAYDITNLVKQELKL